MNWEQKLSALQAIADTCLRMRVPGNWYVSATGRDVSERGMLVGKYGNGPTPESAVEADWNSIAESRATIILNAGRSDRRAVQWNGFMWIDVKE